MLKLDTLRATPIERDPFDYVIVRNFVEHEKLRDVLADYPEVPGPGSHPPAGLKISGHFKELMDELLDGPFRKIVEEKFDINLKGRPTMYTVRGFCRARDGKIHTDSKTKLITVLLYMNDDFWRARPAACVSCATATTLKITPLKSSRPAAHFWFSNAPTIHGTVTTRSKASAARSSSTGSPTNPSSTASKAATASPRRSSASSSRRSPGGSKLTPYPGRMKARVHAADPRRISAAEAEVFPVALELRIIVPASRVQIS